MVGGYLVFNWGAVAFISQSWESHGETCIKNFSACGFSESVLVLVRAVPKLDSDQPVLWRLGRWRKHWGRQNYLPHYPTISFTSASVNLSLCAHCRPHLVQPFNQGPRAFFPIILFHTGPSLSNITTIASPPSVTTIGVRN